MDLTHPLEDFASTTDVFTNIRVWLFITKKCTVKSKMVITIVIIDRKMTQIKLRKKLVDLF